SSKISAARISHREDTVASPLHTLTRAAARAPLRVRVLVSADWVRRTLLLLVIVLLAACGSDDEPEAAADQALLADSSAIVATAPVAAELGPVVNVEGIVGAGT